MTPALTHRDLRRIADDIAALIQEHGGNAEAKSIRARCALLLHPQKRVVAAVQLTEPFVPPPKRAAALRALVGYGKTVQETLTNRSSK